MTLCDFHTHTTLSDGALSPLELVRRAVVRGYTAIAITDHVGSGYLERLVGEVTRDCMLAQNHWGITAIPGVELTHLPRAAIADCARMARDLGAKIVVVHGETTSEPVEPGTNLAAVESRDVDILAHPGRITMREAEIAAANGVFLEITARKQHGQTNRNVVQMARQAGAHLILDSDGHDESDLLTPELARNVARDAGLAEDEIEDVLETNACALLERVRAR